jgi:hypothetical protein
MNVFPPIPGFSLSKIYGSKIEQLFAPFFELPSNHPFCQLFNV